MIFPALIDADAAPAGAGNIDFDLVVIAAPKDDFRTNEIVVFSAQAMAGERIKAAHADSCLSDGFNIAFGFFSQFCISAQQGVGEMQQQTFDPDVDFRIVIQLQEQAFSQVACTKACRV